MASSSNGFTRTTGLEVVEPKIAALNVVGAVPTFGDPLTVHWDCDQNPPGTQIQLHVVGPGGPQSYVGLELTGQQVVVPTPAAEAYVMTLTAGFDQAGLHREVKKVLAVAVL
jgi:hypothetical protein